ncbi:MAG: hypothetical protein ACREFQ_16320, partial [Stellaceae bacterium]
MIARAYSVRFRLTFMDGQHGSSFVSNSNPDPWETRSPMSSAILPGHERLIAPSFDVRPFTWAGGRGWNPSFGNFLLGNRANIEAVTITLDGVVWGNGSFYGPDKRKILE